MYRVYLTDENGTFLKDSYTDVRIAVEEAELAILGGEAYSYEIRTEDNKFVTKSR